MFLRVWRVWKLFVEAWALILVECNFVFVFKNWLNLQAEYSKITSKLNCESFICECWFIQELEI